MRVHNGTKSTIKVYQRGRARRTWREWLLRHRSRDLVDLVAAVPPGETWEVGVGYRGKLLIEAEGGDATFVVINDYAPAAS